MTIVDRPRRSALYLPASNARALDKARTLPADVIILDLEDAVAPDAKAAARDAAVAAVTAGGYGPREVVVRVNGLDSAWGEADLAAVAAARPDAVLVPKVSSASALAAARAILGPDGPPLWAMIETCRAVLDLRAIVDAADTGLTVLVAGTNDLASELRARVDDERTALLPALSAIVTAARAAGLGALDGVCNALDDPARLAYACVQGRTLGFDGKTLIHPAQLAAANDAFAPAADEIAWARSVVAAFADPAAAEKGVLRVDGRMVERLHLVEARRVIGIAARIGAA